MSVRHLYSFTAFFEDGSVVFMDHTKEDSDKSELCEQGSKFTDVLKKSEESKLISFVLHNEKQTVGVDLRDGHFEINTVPFFQHRPELDEYSNFRIIYYRTVNSHQNTVTKETFTEVVSYTIGWQTTHNGENIQKTLTIHPQYHGV